MSNKVYFTATKLSMFKKEGKLTPDESGYYELVVGGLNTYNNTGAWYYTIEGVRELFGPGSILHRRIANGCLRAEVNHPKQKLGESNEAFFNRMLDIDLNNTCAHFKEIWLDEEFGKKNPQYKNPNLVAIMAKVKPAGPKGQMLQESLDNPSENVCFSIRALADEGYVGGKRLRVLKEVVTIDYVNEGGIVVASKWDSPATESIDDSAILEVTRKTIEKAKAGSECFATESSRELVTYVEQKYFKEVKPAVWANW
jgi:hypothetical protein